MTTTTFRQATLQDRDALVRLHRALYIEHRDRVVAPDIMPLLAYRDFEEVLERDVDGLLTARGKFALVAQVDDQVVGYITGHIEHEPQRVLRRRGVVEEWYVDKARRGTGLGRELFARLTEAFSKQGCEAIESKTWASNAEGRGAHEALGFEPIQIVYRKTID